MPAPGGFAPFTTVKANPPFVTIGHMHMNPGWTGEFTYMSSRSTSFGVGVSFDGRGWQAGGSTTVSGSHTAESSGDDLKDDRIFRQVYYRVDMVFEKYRWMCQTAPGEVVYADTIEPTEWTGGNDTFPVFDTPTCQPKYQENVVAYRRLIRGDQSGTYFEGAINVGGFSGATKVATSSGVTQQWKNNVGHDRSVCGENAFPTKVTRVVTLP